MVDILEIVPEVMLKSKMNKTRLKIISILIVDYDGKR